jgi:hypothetical protein
VVCPGPTIHVLHLWFPHEESHVAGYCQRDEDRAMVYDEAMFLSQNRVRAVNTRLTLATTKKGNQSTARYIGKMRALVYEMTATGRPL